METFRSLDSYEMKLMLGSTDTPWGIAEALHGITPNATPAIEIGDHPGALKRNPNVDLLPW